MSKSQQLAQLQQLTDMILDHRLGAVRAAARLRADTLRKIEALRAPPAFLEDSGDTGGISGAIAALSYQSWAEARRIELRQVLATQTAAWLDAKDAAQHAFGKSQSLDGARKKIAAA
ncbi:MAG: hypothetical protein ACK4SS_07240, partial [Cypionkella sp.]